MTKNEIGETENVNFTIGGLFNIIYEVVDKEQPVTIELIKQCHDLKKAIEQMSIFSNDENEEDIDTVILQYIMIPYLLGSLYYAGVQFNGNWSDFPSHRRTELNKTVLAWTELIDDMEKRRFFVSYTEYERYRGLVNRDLSFTSDRSQYIEVSRKLKGCISNLENLLITDPDSRETVLLKIEIALLNVVNSTNALMQELQLLENVPTREELDESEKEPVPKAWCVKLESKDELISKLKNQVFKPGFNLPTKTLDDVVLTEMQQAASLENDHANYKTKSEFISNEDEVLAEDAENLESRQWDDYKDEVPRGWGNPRKNRG